MPAKTEVTDVSLFGKIAGYIEILSKDPHSTVFVPLSDAYRKLGLVDEAIKAARKGTEAVPAYLPGFVVLARLLAESGDLAAAAAAFQKALALEPEHLPALTGMIRVHMMRNEKDQALTLLRRAYQLAPDDALVSRMVDGLPGARAKLASAAPDVLAAPPLPRTTGAVASASAEPADDAAELPAGGKPPIATATIADIYIRQGFPEKALKVYGDLLQSEPNNLEVRTRYEALRREIEASQAATSPMMAATVPALDVAAPVSRSLTDVQSDKASLSRAEKRIATLQRWLDAVNRRRAHV